MIELEIRNAEVADYDGIISVLNDWWGGRQMSDMLPRLFFNHFQTTSFIALYDGKVVGFLIGFNSPSLKDEAYIHFVGVHPEYRMAAVGKQLYEQFFRKVAGFGRSIVRSCTSPVNKASIAFHTRMGFTIGEGDAKSEGIAYFSNYDGPGEHRVLFTKRLDLV